MNDIRRSHAEQRAPALVSGNNALFDKMDAGSEWERVPQQPHPHDMTLGVEMAHAFEFDIHDCSISEVNR